MAPRKHLPLPPSFKFYTADELGLVKAITITPTPTTPTKPKKKSKKDHHSDSEDDDSKKLKSEQPKDPFTVSITKFGTMDKTHQIQKMVFWNGELADGMGSIGKRIIIARQSGFIQIMNPTNGFIEKTYAIFTPDPTNLDKRKKPEFFIGVETHAGYLFVCTSRGVVMKIPLLESSETFFTPATTYPDQEGKMLYTIYNLNQVDLHVMRVLASDTNVFVTGGDERDIAIWDMSQIKELPKESSAEETKSQEQPTIHTLEPIWKAKNVANDFLDLRVPIWITDLHILPTSTKDSLEIVTCSAYRHVRYYKTSQQRRPVTTWDLSTKLDTTPLKKLSLVPVKPTLDANGDSQVPEISECIVTDTTGILLHLNFRTGVELGRYKGSVGAVASMETFMDSTDRNRLVGVGVDRYLRVWEVLKSKVSNKKPGYGAPGHKVYLKTRVTGVLVDQEEEIVQEQKGDEKDTEMDNEVDDETLWNMIPTLEESAPKLKKRKISSSTGKPLKKKSTKAV